MEAKRLNIVREVSTEPAEFQLKVTLESGVTLYVCRHGGAEGSDGKRYFPILREVRETFCGYEDIIAKVIGWSSELDREKVLPLDSGA